MNIQTGLIDCEGNFNPDFDPSNGVHLCAKLGLMTGIRFYLDKTTVDESVLNNGLFGAVQGKNTDLVDFFLAQGADDLEHAMYLAAVNGDERNVYELVRSGACDYNNGLLGAVAGNHQNLVMFFLRKKATNLMAALECAIEKEHEEIVKILLVNLKK